MIEYILPEANRTISQDIPSNIRASKLDNNILGLLDMNADYFSKNRNFDYHPHYYVTLDKIAQIATNASEIHNSITRLTNIIPEKNDRVAYLYAYLIEENKKAIVKICLLRPPIHKRGEPRDATRMCQKALEASTPILDRIIKARASKPLSVPVDNPENLMFKETVRQGGPSDIMIRKLELEPDAISLESELNRFLAGGFKLSPTNSNEDSRSPTEVDQRPTLNVKPVPIQHIISDWMGYLEDSKQVVRIARDYHLVNDQENPSLTVQEIHRHLLVCKGVFSKTILPKVNKTLSMSSSENYTQAYNSWKEYTHETEKTDIVGETDLILRVMNTINFNGLDEKRIGFSQKSIRRLLEIMKGLYDFMSSSSTQKTEDIIQDIAKQIKYNSESRKLLTLVNFDEELNKNNYMPGSKDTAVLKDILDTLSKNFAYLAPSDDLRDPKDFQKIYFVDASRLTGIIANLAKHALKNKIFLEQYEIAKKIKKNLVNDVKIHPELDSEMSAAEIAEAQRIIEELGKILSLEKQKGSAKLFQDHDYTKGVLLSAFYIGTIFTLATVVNPYLIFLALTYPLLVKLFFSTGSDKKKKSKTSKKTLDTQSDFMRQVQKYFKENIKDGHEIANMSSAKVMTFEQLNNFLNNTEDLRQAFPALKDQNQSQIRGNLKNTLLKNMASIVFRTDEVPSGSFLGQKGVPFPKEIYIEKSSLSNATFRRKLAGFFRGEFAGSSPSDKKRQAYFRKLIETMENPREYTKYLKL